MENVDPNEARQVQSRYLCSDCYGYLGVWFNGKTSAVKCATPGCACRGFVRKSTVELRESRSMAEYLDAKYLLTQAGAIAAPARIDINKALAELGY